MCLVWALQIVKVFAFQKQWESSAGGKRSYNKHITKEGFYRGHVLHGNAPNSGTPFTTEIPLHRKAPDTGKPLTLVSPYGGTPSIGNATRINDLCVNATYRETPVRLEAFWLRSSHLSIDVHAFSRARVLALHILRSGGLAFSPARDQRSRRTKLC